MKTRDIHYATLVLVCIAIILLGLKVRTHLSVTRLVGQTRSNPGNSSRVAESQGERVLEAKGEGTSEERDIAPKNGGDVRPDTNGDPASLGEIELG